MSAVAVLALVFAGLLAGEEFIVRWGVAPALSTLPDHAHLHARIALVRRLRVLVPMLILPTLALVTTAAIWAAPSPWAWAALAALTVFVATTAFGTVPINMQVIDWNPHQPPANWRAVITRWQTIDVLRAGTALAGFVLLTLALT